MSKFRETGVGVGPLITDLGGNLDTPILTCYDGEEDRCIHFGIHDGHYFYCAAQDAPNKHVAEGEYAYPWVGAGKQLRQQHPDEGCPFY